MAVPEDDTGGWTTEEVYDGGMETVIPASAMIDVPEIKLFGKMVIK